MRAGLLRIACLVAAACAFAVQSPMARAEDPDRACLEALGAANVAFSEAPPTRGVRTPILVRGPLGAITLRSRDSHPADAAALMDCGLARALLEVAPVFADTGIRTLVYSGTYAYRSRRGGTKLSEHAHGLAIDVHAFVARDGTLYDVRRDFEPGVGLWATVAELPDCVGRPGTPAARLLRTVACRLRAGSTLREVITPDDNSDHADHLHLEAFPDAATRARGLLSPRIPVIDD